MQRSPVALWPIAAALLLGACMGDRDTSASRLNAPTGSLASGNPNVCNFNDMAKAARDYLSANDEVVKMVGDMQTAYNANGTAGATPVGLDILAKIATKRLTTAQTGTNDEGGDLVTLVVSPKCSDIESGVPQATLDEFKPAEALAAGVFEVRGGSNALAAVAFVPNTGGGRTQASPRWGAEPKAGCPLTDDPNTTGLCTWPPLSTTGNQKRYLLFAYPTTVVTSEPLSTDNSFSGSNAFIIGMMPDIGDKSVFSVGLCASGIATNSDGDPVGANLGLHSGSYLGTRSLTMCATGYPTQAMLESKAWFASLTHRAASLLAPSQLFAELSLDGESRSVGPTGWSPITFVKVTSAATSLTFVNMPKTGKVGTDFELQVLATTSTTTGTTTTTHPVPGVTVTIDLANNSGVPAGAQITNPPATGITKDDGIAHIFLSVNKAGGYTFSASGNLGGAATNTTTSTQILNIKNAK